MADITYLIKYDDTNGLQTEQHIVGVSTNVDRVRFVTTKETQDYAGQEGRKVAIKRDPISKTPFKEDWDDPYLVPLDSAPPDWINVIVKDGHGYHWFCGSVDGNQQNFERWEGGNGQHSLPFPW